MSITIGTIVFNTDVADANGIKWYCNVDGWDTLSQRVTTVELPAQHGEITAANLYAARQMTVTGVASCPSEAAYYTAKNLLHSATNALTRFATTAVYVIITEDVDRRMQVLRTSLLTRCIDSRVLAFEMTLRADDPFKYANTASTLVTSGTATNAGTAATYPTFTLSAPGAPTLTVGASTWSATASLPSGTVIDMANMTVANGVTDYFANVSLASEWLALAPGANTVTSTVAGTWTWRSAWL